MKKKILGMTIVIGTIILIAGAGVVSALNENPKINFKPANLGTWWYVGGGDPSNYSKIQEAIENSSDGDTIFVYDDLAPYLENIRINKQLLVLGENKDTTIINGITGQDHVVRMSSKNAEINGFTIKGAAGGQDGIVVYPLMEDITISNNIIKDCSYGIFLQATSARTTITDNIITNNNYQGIILQQSDRNNIIGNSIIENGDFGISVGISSKQNWIIDNNIEDNFGGIQITGSSSQNNISGNEILNNKMEGILIKGLLSTANEITGNNITSNYAGIKINNGGKSIISSNNIKNTKMTGISLALSNDNIIQMNNFIDNRRNARFVFSFRNTWDSNYWDDWIGIRFSAPLFKKFPKVIRGIVLRNYDSNPQEVPYDI
jgi:parallel beta-helix repeat protein